MELHSPARPILDPLHLNPLKHMLLKDIKDLFLSTPPLPPLHLVKLHDAWPSNQFRHKVWTLATEELRRHRLLTSPLSW